MSMSPVLALVLSFFRRDEAQKDDQGCLNPTLGMNVNSSLSRASDEQLKVIRVPLPLSGQAIRDLGFNTTIGQSEGDGGTRAEGVCASACSYAFAGGVYRHYTQATQRLGLHQFFYVESDVGDVGDAQLISGLLVHYLQRMGVDADAFGVAAQARRDSMVWLSIDDALELNFSNNGALPASAQVKLLESPPYSPYLKLEQSRSGAMSRVLMICLKNELYVWGGVVVPQATSQEHLETASTNYLEFDDQLKLELSASQGTRLSENVLWVTRRIPRDRYEAVANAKLIGTWFEDGSPMRWGSYINLKGVRENVSSYVQRCRSLQN